MSLIADPLPSSYKALTFTSPSSPLHLTHTPLTPPGPDELLVKVHAAAINPFDIQIWNSPLLGWIAGKKEKGAGRDYSGTVVQVGGRVNGWSVGDEIFGLLMRLTGEGTFGQYIKVKPAADPTAKKPKIWTHNEAAAVPLVVLTAWKMLQWLPRETNSSQQRRVVVAGASGGTGMWCVQLAKKLYNCHVTGICSAKNADFVRGLGADEVIDYTTEDVVKKLLDGRLQGRKYDLYLDCVGGTELFSRWHELLHGKAAYVTIVGDKTSRMTLGGPIVYFTHPSSLFRFIKGSIFGPRYANIELEMKSSEPLKDVVALAEKNEVQIVVQDVLQGVLDEASDEWRAVWKFMEEGRVRGKIVVEIA